MRATCAWGREKRVVDAWGEVMDLYERIAAFYDATVPYRKREDVTFFVDMACESGGPVLELGCGTGRVLIPTARAGFEITGLDASPAMLKVCQRSLAREPEDVRDRVTLVQGDMRNFGLDEGFALVTLPFRPFQHLLEVEDQIACLSCIHAHLNPGGLLILDLFNPMIERLTEAKYPTEFELEPPATLEDGSEMVRSSRMIAPDIARQCIDIELRHDITFPDGRKEQYVENMTLRYFFRYEVEHLLARCGFEVENLYADYARTPFGEIYPSELLFVARKI